MDLSNGHDSLRFNVVLQFKEDYHVTKMSIKVECHEVYILLPNCQTTHTHMETKQTWQTVKKGLNPDCSRWVMTAFSLPSPYF